MNGSGSITANRSASVTARRYPAARLAAPPASFQPRNAATSVGRFSLGVDSIVITSTLEVSHTRRTCPYYAGDARGLRRDRCGSGLSAAIGFRRGLVGQALALGGFALGALIGSRIGPHALSSGARESWQPVAALVGAVVGGLVAQIATAPLADTLRRRFLRGPLGTIDGAGGLVVGVALGLAVAWLLAVTALHQPSLGLRGDVQRSSILPRLVRWLPAQSLLDAIARLDQLPVLPVGGVRSLPAPDSSLEVAPAVRRAEASVVLVEGTSCGLTLQGSGWVVRPGLVATNAHVLAGEHDTRVLLGDRSLTANPVYVSASTDVALLRVPDLERGRAAPSPPIPTAARGWR